MPKISDPVYPSQTGANVANGDQLYIVDIGSPNVSKKITADQLAQMPQLSSRYVPKSGDAIWIGPHEMTIGLEGSPSLGFCNAVPAILLDASARELVGFSWYPPQYWGTYHIDLYWSNAGAGSGDVYIEGVRGTFGDGETLEANQLNLGNLAVTAPAQNILKITRLTTSAASVVAGEMCAGFIGRKGTEASDTLGNDAALLGLVMVRAS